MPTITTKPNKPISLQFGLRNLRYVSLNLQQNMAEAVWQGEIILHASGAASRHLTRLVSSYISVPAIYVITYVHVCMYALVSHSLQHSRLSYYKFRFCAACHCLMSMLHILVHTRILSNAVVAALIHTYIHF